MKDLGSLQKYGVPMAERLLDIQKDVGPRSHVTVRRFATAAAARTMVKGSPAGAYAIVPERGKPLAILAPANGDRFHVITGSMHNVPMNVEKYLKRSTLKDVYGLFRAINRTYGKQHWELHEITPDADRVDELGAQRKAAMEEAKPTPTTRQELQAKLKAYRKSKIPEANTAEDVLGLIVSSKTLPVNFVYNGLLYELGNTRFLVDDNSGKFYKAGEEEMVAGVEYRANIDDYSRLLKELGDNDEEMVDEIPKSIEIHYEMDAGGFVPSTVRLKF